MIDCQKISKVAGVEVYPSSVVESGKGVYFMGRKCDERFIGCVGGPCLSDSSKVGEIDGKCVCLGTKNAANAAAIREALPWTSPQCLGLKTSAGLGDRLGLATPGHIRAIRGTGIAPVLAQQSIRELARTKRTPQEVIDCTTFGVLQEGYRDGFGSDADHLQESADIDRTVQAGFTQFTIDPGRHVVNGTDSFTPVQAAAEYERLDFKTLEITNTGLLEMYVDKPFTLEGGSGVAFDDEDFLRAAVKYGNAVAHVVRMYRRLCEKCKRSFEVEVSVDETDTPTSPAEHYFFAAELKRLGVKWVSLAPRFVGRFEKGVDYIGDIRSFRSTFEQHVAVMRTLGPYKISIHSGSDKFAIYQIVAELTGGLVHLKTAGTSYLEALRAIAGTQPGLFREILDFARGRYETDKQSYHVSADVSKVPPASSIKDADLPVLLGDFHARQVLHVTFGSVLAEGDGNRFKAPLLKSLRANESVHYDAIQKHIAKHLQGFIPFVKK
ncbi:MAG: hypothetical protein HZA50_16230 [Planctomycetes bacterium]|nr:hypothetical protein [Planctomycetota bacterium]